MEKLMTLEVLSSIKGAESSVAIEELFENIKNANTSVGENQSINNNLAVHLGDLRKDEVIESSELEKSIIRNNFPNQKNNYLVVSRVIEE
ncbi:MAG: Asp-tRNA(Asn)/Glu-tRNA(Gln) amidotransferase C subunit [Flammeovirgaceae bacterium]|jgi:Asp-tRNA(Asn)/Glu-tRNA(Gln) amidotransferase C subunit